MDGPKGQESADGWRPPPEFDGYCLSRLLGHGGMGDVYLGHDTLLDRPIAIKFIRATDAPAREMFLNEARAAAKLQHPNVVSVYRVGEIEGHPYIISEYIRGRSLDRLPRPIPWQRVLEIGIGLARGLAAAHHRGILHRGRSPTAQRARRFSAPTENRGKKEARREGRGRSPDRQVARKVSPLRPGRRY